MVTNLEKEARSLDDYWSPKVVGQVNDQYVKVAKVKGDLAWHKHDAEDELFLVLAGRLRIEYEDHIVELEKGEFHVVPRGKLHNPVCNNECLIALIETTTTQHTGEMVMEKTRSISAQLNENDGE
ncbi:MAG TPA: cupin domain-containing protein [Pseudomonadales bacterium]|jgi:mannose-6-phosphate isomerase-like protein (cupin superfamily)|nr:cupin domain-containing protein [Pseudomonadales bacterium]|tara:strand:- start:1 stop:375 length:375 start_codon:yes stop_codon:yes gene_type:complete